MTTVFIVTLETVDYHTDPHGGLVSKEVSGVYTTKAGANASAKGLLLGDDFDTYEETTDWKGDVAVYEGETMRVAVSAHVVQEYVEDDEEDGTEEDADEEEEEEEEDDYVELV
jgi:hypothetical protein